MVDASQAGGKKSSQHGLPKIARSTVEVVNVRRELAESMAARDEMQQGEVFLRGVCTDRACAPRNLVKRWQSRDRRRS